MKRFWSNVRWDIQLQFRNGFYYISAFVAILFIILLKQLGEVNWAIWWPVIILENLVINTFYFMAGLVLLEKGEGTLEAQIVTPLRPWEYLFSKVISLGLLSLLESLLIVTAVSGLNFNWLLLILGILLLVSIYVLYGFFVVARYDAIGEFILPSAVWTMGFSLPLLYYFNIWTTNWMFLHPLQAPLVLMQSAFESLPAWQIIYGILYSLVWIFIGYLITQRTYHRFVVTKQGVK
ncbi:MAG: ABC transporter permease [Anaerolineaceae bacterium]|nr:ABC transporter permease [Anaerolineaceae bacterium]